MQSPRNRPDETDANNYRWLTVALSSIALLVAWYGVKDLWAHQAYTRAGCLVLGLVAFCIHGAHSRVHEFFKARDYRGYFGTSFVIITFSLWAAAGTKTPAWLLCLPVFSQAILMLPGRQIAPVAVSLYLASFYPIWDNPAEQAFRLFMNFFFTGIFSWVLRRQRESRYELLAAHEKLRAYTAQAEALGGAEERARLAREIHDGVAHHLTSANVLIEAGHALLPPDIPALARDSLQKAQGQIRAALSEIRQSIAERRNPTDTAPLADRIKQLIQAGNFPATLTLCGTPRRLTPEAEHALYRVAQEALTNARKHAPATAIAIELGFTETGVTRLHVDNAEPAQTASGDGAFGLLSLRERVAKLGGSFAAGSTPGGRFVVEAEIPA